MIVADSNSTFLGVSMKKRPRVALLIETSNSYARGLLRGIHAFMRDHGSWSTYLTEQGRGGAPPIWLNAKWRGDGIIARIENRRIAQAVLRTKVPVVNVSSSQVARKTPRVATNGLAVARLAAEHLAERGLKHFGFCGDDRFEWSLRRSDEFARIIADMGYACDIYGAQKLLRSALSWNQEEVAMTEWLRELPKPAGVMVCHDLRGLQLLQVCQRMGLTVPDEVAVLGVDNDELLCNLSTPTLSSINQDTFRIGYEAARLLDLWMRGKHPGDGMQIDPLGVVLRQSTNMLCLTDPHVATAVRFIRDHACDGINVDDVLAEVPLSRRALEHRFKKLLGHTPHDEILKLQFLRVKQLLTESSLPMATIAARTGFRHVEYLSSVFKQRFGMPPSEYRTAHQR
jgi:LacI family transcriptional regulator